MGTAARFLALIWDVLTSFLRGGIRGIIELEYLQTLEKALNGRNGRLRVQSFFDLVIGTRLVYIRAYKEDAYTGYVTARAA